MATISADIDLNISKLLAALGQATTAAKNAATGINTAFKGIEPVVDVAVDLNAESAKNEADALSRQLENEFVDKPVTIPIKGSFDEVAKQAKAAGAAVNSAFNGAGVTVVPPDTTGRLEALKSQLAAVKVRMSEIRSTEGFGKNFSEAASEARKLQKEIEGIENATNGLGDAVEETGKSFDGLGDKKIDIGGQLFEGLKGGILGGIIGGGIAGLVQTGLSAIGEGFSKVIEIGAEFQTSLQSVSAVTGVTGAGLTDIGERAQGLAAKFGGGASEQLGVFQTALSKIGPQLAGSSTDLTTFADNVNTLSKTDSALGAAGAVDALSGALLQFGVNVDDTAEVARESTRFMNVLAASAGVGSASVSDVAAAIAVSGSSMANANVSFEEGNAALQVLASKSLVGSQAGTALTAVLNKLQAASGPAADKLLTMGTSSAKLGELLTTKGIGAAIDELRTAMGNLGGTAEKNAFLVSLFGETGLNAAAALLGGGDKLKQFTEGVTGTQAATEQAATNMATFGETMSRIGAQISNVAIAVFQTLEPAMTFIAQLGANIFAGFIDAIGFVVDVLSVLSPLLITVGAAMAAYAVVTNAGAIATFLATTANTVMAAGLAALQTVMAITTTAATTMWAAVTAPVGIVIAAIAAVGLGLYLLYQNVEPFRVAIDAAFSFVAEVGSQVADIFSEIGDALSVVGDLVFTVVVLPFKVLWAVVQPIGAALFDLVGSLFSFNDAGEKTGGVMEFLTGVFDKIKLVIQVVKASIAGLTAAFDTVVGTVQNVVKAAANFSLSGIIDAFKTGGKDAAKAFNDGAAESLNQDVFDNGLKNAERAFSKGVEINAKIKTVSSLDELQKTLTDSQEKLKPLQVKVEAGQKLTPEEQKSFDELTKAAVEASGKIKEIAPDAVSGVKTIISANGELSSVYEFNSQKLGEFANQSKKTFGAELQADQKKYSDSVLQASGAFEAQKKQLAGVKAELEKTTDPKKAAELQEKYGELSKAVETSGKAISKSFSDGAKEGLLTADAAAKLEKQLGFASGTAARLAPSFKEPTERATELIDALNKQVAIKVKTETDATAVTTLATELEGIQGKLKPLQLKVAAGQALTPEEQKSFDELAAKAGDVSAKIKKIAPDTSTTSKEIVTSTGKVIQVFDVSKDKVTEFGDNAKKAGEQTKTALSGSFSAGFTQLGAELEKQKTKIATLKAQIAATPEGAKKNELSLELEKTQNQATATGNAMKKAFLDGSNAGLVTAGTVQQIEKSFGLAAGQGDVLLQSLKDQAEQARLAALDVQGIADAYAATGKAAAELQNTSKAQAAGLDDLIRRIEKQGLTTAQIFNETKVQYKDEAEALQTLKAKRAQILKDENKAQKDAVDFQRTVRRNDVVASLNETATAAKTKEKIGKDTIAEDEKAAIKAAQEKAIKEQQTAEELEIAITLIKADAQVKRLNLEKASLIAANAEIQRTEVSAAKRTASAQELAKFGAATDNTGKFLALTQETNQKIKEIEGKALAARFAEQSKQFAENAAAQVASAQTAVKIIEAQTATSSDEEIARLNALNSAKLDLITAESRKEIEAVISKNADVVTAEKALKDAITTGDKDLTQKAIVAYAEARRSAFGSDEIVVLAAETNKKLIAQNAESAVVIKDASIQAIEDVALRTREIALAENEKTLAASIAAAKGNRQKEYVAYVEFAKQKAAIQAKYEEDTATNSQKLLKASIKALTAIEKGFTFTISEEERKRTEEKKAELDKQGDDYLAALKKGELDYNTFLQNLDALDKQRAELTDTGGTLDNIFSAVNASLSASLQGIAETLKASSDASLQAVDEGYRARAELAQTAADLEKQIDEARGAGQIEREKELQSRLQQIRENGEKSSTDLQKKASDLQAKINLAHNEGRTEDEKKLRTDLDDTQKQIAGDTKKTSGAIVSALEDMSIAAGLSFVDMIAQGASVGKALKAAAFDLLDSMIPVFAAMIFGVTSSSPANIASLGTWGAIAFIATMAALKGLVAVARSAAGAEGGAPEGITATYNKPKGATDTIPLWVAPREAIINARQSDEWRETLVAINSGGNVLRSVIGNASGAEFAALMREKFSPAEIAELTGVSFSEPTRIAEMPRPSISRMDAPTQNIVIMQDMTAEMRTVVKSVRAMHKDLSVQSRKPVEVLGGKIKTDGNNITATFERLRKRNVTRG